MVTTTLSSKGQMIVPKRIRDALALKPGDDLVVALEPDGFSVRTRRNRKQAIERLAGSLKQPGRRRPMSIAEMDQAVRDKALAEDRRTKGRRAR